MILASYNRYGSIEEELEMSVVLLADLQKDAYKQKYAIPHFLGANLEMIISAIQVAERKRSPVALGFAPEVFYMIPMEIVVPAMVAAAKRASIPVALQLEHGSGYDQVAAAIHCGLSSVMFDGSHLPYEENVKLTKEITKMAHAFGASVEAELGNVGGSALADAVGSESTMTDPLCVSDFIEKTRIDSLAISFGNYHGKFKAVPRLNYDIVKQAIKQANIPLTMHGGSGFSKEEYRKCIESGISNIHFYTYITLDLWRTLQGEAGNYENKPVYHQISDWTIKYFEGKIGEAMEMLGSVGKA